TCGQKKKDNILFIEPTSPSCNSHFSLDTDGFINPRGFKNRKEKHSIQTTIDMLGLNKPHLQLERKKQIERLIYILKATKHNRHELTNKFIKSGNFKYILRELTM
ncbi:TPA: HNH endonuclease, partial [Vibrio cholerae]